MICVSPLTTLFIISEICLSLYVYVYVCLCEALKTFLVLKVLHTVSDIKFKL